MRRETTGGVLLALLAPLLAGCGPDWQPSWNMSSQPTVPGDGLTVSRVTGGDPVFQPVRSENVEQIRQSIGSLLSSRPASPEAAMTQVPDYNPVPRPDMERQTTPARPRGSSTPPPNASVPPPRELPRPQVVDTPPEPDQGRREGEVVNIPGQPPAVVTNSTGRVQSIVQPGNPAGGVTVRDGGTTTVIQPGGRVTTIPSPR